jgi:hypothetical protein
MPSTQIAACALIAGVSSGCFAEDDPTSWQSQALLCPPLVCGNTNAMGVYAFYELDEKAVSFSPVGKVRIRSFTHFSGEKMTLDVLGKKLTGKREGGGSYSGTGLVNSTLTIESETPGLTFDIKIKKADTVPYFEDGAADGGKLPVYRLTVTKKVDGRTGAPTVSLCGDDPDSDPVGQPKYAMFSQGDRYDPEKGTVIATGADAEPWFNVACMDDVIWKANAFRYHEPGSTGEFVTEMIERTAIVQATRADYCGTGEAFTVPHTDLDWANDHGWLSIQPDPLLEAVWDGDGAMCLDTPRLVDRDTLPCAATLPYCSSGYAPDGAPYIDWGWFDDGGFIVTYAQTDGP